MSDELTEEEIQKAVYEYIDTLGLNKKYDLEIIIAKAQLAADKKVCEECRERQEAEIADLKDEVLFKTLALKANGESQDKMATEIASLKSQIK